MVKIKPLKEVIASNLLCVKHREGMQLMAERRKAFTKRAKLAAGAAAVAGAGAAYLTGKLTGDSDSVGLISTVSSAVAGLGLFLPYYARDIREIYTEKGEFNWGRAVKDQSPLLATSGVLGTMYVMLKPVVVSRMMKRGMEDWHASVMFDLTSDVLKFIAYRAVALNSTYHHRNSNSSSQ